MSPSDEGNAVRIPVDDSGNRDVASPADIGIRRDGYRATQSAGMAGIRINQSAVITVPPVANMYGIEN